MWSKYQKEKDMILIYSKIKINTTSRKYQKEFLIIFDIYHKTSIIMLSNYQKEDLIEQSKYQKEPVVMLSKDQQNPLIIIYAGSED